MTPDLVAGLLIGSFAIYAAWLFSLRPEPLPTADEMYGILAPYLRDDGYDARRHLWDVTCDAPPDDDPDCHCLGVTRSQIRWEKPDPIGDALVFLDEAFSDE